MPLLALHPIAPSYLKLFTPFLITSIPTCLKAWPPHWLTQNVQLGLSWKRQSRGVSLGTASSSTLLPASPSCAVTEEGAFFRDRSSAINFLAAVAINLLQRVCLSSWALALLGRWVASLSNPDTPEPAQKRASLVLPSRFCPKSQCRDSLETWCWEQKKCRGGSRARNHTT